MKWQSLLQNKKFQLAVVGAVSAAASATATFLATSKILEKKYREIADAEIQEAKVYYQGLYSRSPIVIAEEPSEEKEDPAPGNWDELSVVTQQHMITRAIEAVTEYSSSSTDPEPVEDPRPPVDQHANIVNVFQNHTPPGEEVLAALLTDRDPSEPYIITKEEYYQNDPDHEQKAFTFYEGDSILVDDEEEYSPIQDTERVAGDDNLLRFGYGSGDEHILYIRNETLDPPMDLCITRSPGRYTDEVMGFNDDEPHLKHAQPRRFRLHDE